MQKTPGLKETMPREYYISKLGYLLFPCKGSWNHACQPILVQCVDLFLSKLKDLTLWPFKLIFYLSAEYHPYPRVITEQSTGWPQLGATLLLVWL